MVHNNITYEYNKEQMIKKLSDFIDEARERAVSFELNGDFDRADDERISISDAYKEIYRLKSEISSYYWS